VKKVKNLKVSEIVALVILLALVVSIPVLIWGLKTQEFDVRKKAASGEDPNKPGYIMVYPAASTTYVGEILSVDIEFRPYSIVDQAKPISSLTIELIFPETYGDFDIVDVNGNPTDTIEPNENLLNTGNWAFPVRSVIRENGKIRIELAAINLSTEGYQSTDLVSIARFYLKTYEQPENGKIPIYYNEESTTMIAKEDARDILGVVAVPTINVSYEAMLDFGYKMQGIGVNTSTTMSGYEITFINASGNQYSYQGSSLLNGDGVFRNEYSLTLDNLPTNNTYLVYLKDTRHLRKELGFVTILPGVNQAPVEWEDKVLLAGDFDNNNILNIIDLGMILSEYKALQNPVNPTNQIYDVNWDNMIDIFDVTLVISNYTEIQVFGD